MANKALHRTTIPLRSIAAGDGHVSRILLDERRSGGKPGFKGENAGMNGRKARLHRRIVNPPPPDPSHHRTTPGQRNQISYQ